MNLFGTKKKKYEEDRIPVSVDDVIPIRESCDDGICLVGKNLWSKTYRFSDINYATASKEIKEDLFMAYSEMLNSLDSGGETKITINNRRLIKSRFEKTNMLSLMGDEYDKYRREYGLSYEIVSPNHDRLMGIFDEFCDKYGIMKNRECFEYLSELPEKYRQLTLF